MLVGEGRVGRGGTLALRWISQLLSPVKLQHPRRPGEKARQNVQLEERAGRLTEKQQR